MILGNQATQDIFRAYMLGETHQRTQIPFILLLGPSHIGKTSLLIQTVGALLGDYMHQDFLYVQDFSEKIGKRHNLKLRTNDSNLVSKQLLDEFQYEDIGVEDVIAWLQRSGISGKKFVFLENIDRLVPGAAQTLLKSLEEPLEGRVIVASASHISSVLPTLVSRALTLQFHSLHVSDMYTYVQANYPGLSYVDTIVALAQGRPGLVSLLVALFSTIPEAFVVLDAVLHSGMVANKYLLYKALSQFQKAGFIDIVLDGLIAHFVVQKKYDLVEDWLYMKKYVDTNVSFENIALRTLAT